MELKLNNIILVPTDFSEVCENAISQAARTARFLNYKVVLLHVINQETKAWMKDEKMDPNDLNVKLSELAEETARSFGIKVESVVREGSIFTVIAEVAADIGADLIYLGTHGKAGIQHFTGSFALKVVTSSDVPVIVVQKRQTEKLYKDIVLPVTSDAGPMEKTRWATYIARKFNATIHLYRAPDPELHDVVKIHIDYFEKNNVPYDVKIAQKSSGYTKQVIEYATESNADLIMIMTSPESSSLKTFILGKYDEDIIFNASQIPVMCINPRRYNWEKITPFGY